jgi:hypothetical protein
MKSDSSDTAVGQCRLLSDRKWSLILLVDCLLSVPVPVRTFSEVPLDKLCIALLVCETLRLNSVKKMFHMQDKAVTVSKTASSQESRPVYNLHIFYTGWSKSLCTWWLQYRKLQVMFKVFPVGLQTFTDMANCVLEDFVQYSTVHIPNVFCDGNLQIFNFVRIFSNTLSFSSYCNHQVHRDLLITLCSHSYSSSKNLQSQVMQFKHGHRRLWRYSKTRVFQNVLNTCTTNFFFVRAYSVLTALTTFFSECVQYMHHWPWHYFRTCTLCIPPPPQHDVCAQKIFCFPSQDGGIYVYSNFTFQTSYFREWLL